jgi:hypothetical protein
MLGRVFLGKNDTVASKHSGARKKNYFFFSTFLVQCYREPITGESTFHPRCAGPQVDDLK